MAKVKWGSDDNAITADALEGVETDDAGYRGKEPPKGAYRFAIKVYKGESQAGNPKLEVRMELVPTDSDDKKYAGFRLRDYIPVLASTAFRVRPFLDALGVKPRDFVNSCNTKQDEEGELVVSIGSLSLRNATVDAYIWKRSGDEYHRVRYLPKGSGDVEEVVDAEIVEEDDGHGVNRDEEDPF